MLILAGVTGSRERLICKWSEEDGEMVEVEETKNALWRREEQLRRWEASETNSELPKQKNRDESKVKFQDGCVFLAACSSGDRDEVTELLAKGADINTTNVDGLTALHQVRLDQRSFIGVILLRLIMQTVQ